MSLLAAVKAASTAYAAHRAQGTADTDYAYRAAVHAAALIADADAPHACHWSASLTIDRIIRSLAR